MTVAIKNTDAPGTYRSEKDESQGQPVPAGTRSVAVVGLFAKGPTNRRVKVSSPDELLAKFGAADVTKLGFAWWVAYEALSETTEVYIVRVINDPATGNKLKYASLRTDNTLPGWETASGVAELATSAVVAHDLLPVGKGYSANKIIALDGMTVNALGISIASAVAGLEGNLLGIEVVGAKLTLTYTATSAWDATPDALVLGALFKDSGNHVWRVIKAGTVGITQPTWPATPYLGQTVTDGTVTWTSSTELRERDVLGVSARYPDFWQKVLRLRVYKKTSSSQTSFSGLPIMDEFFFTPDETFTAGGSPMQLSAVVNGKGRGLVYGRAGTDLATITLSTFDGSLYNTNGIEALLGGLESAVDINSVEYLPQVQAGWELFRNREYSSWNITCSDTTPDFDAAYLVSQRINDIVATRMDGMYTAQVSKIADIRKETVEQTADAAFAGLKDPSYAAFYAGFDLRVDPNTGKRTFIPKSIEGMRAILKASRMFNEAQAPAGADVGICRGIEQNVEFTKDDCGYLYSKNINVSIKKPEGNVLWGQKTAQRVVSKRDRINTRRILNTIGVEIEEVGDSLIWKNISPSLIERLYSAIDRKMEQRSGEGFFDLTSPDSGRGYRITVSRDPDNKNRLNARVVVLPVDTNEWIGVEIVVGSSGTEARSEA